MKTETHTHIVFPFVGKEYIGEIISFENDVYYVKEEDGTKHRVKKEKVIKFI